MWSLIQTQWETEWINSELFVERLTERYVRCKTKPMFVNGTALLHDNSYIHKLLDTNCTQRVLYGAP